MEDFTKYDPTWEQIALILTTNGSELEQKIRREISYKKYLRNKDKYKNLKIIRDLKIKETREELRKAIKHLTKANDLYKELYHKTEYWERKSTYDFEFKKWEKIKKVNGRLTRYIKELAEIGGKEENENN